MTHRFSDEALFDDANCSCDRLQLSGENLLLVLKKEADRCRLQHAGLAKSGSGKTLRETNR